MREPARKFIAPNGRMATQPIRQLQAGGDPPEVVERIAAATAMCDEPECVSKAIIDAQGELARTYDALRYRAEVGEAQQARRLLSAEARLADVRRRAKLRHVDLGREFHACKTMLERARAGGRQDTAVLRKLEGLEARLDYRPDLEAA